MNCSDHPYPWRRDCMGCEIDKAEAKVAELEAKQQWISVDDRLPELTEEYTYVDRYCNTGKAKESVTVLVTDGVNRCSGVLHNSCGDWVETEIDSDKITHWMPLPDLPKQLLEGSDVNT